MPVWTLETVTNLPQITLDSWSVFEVPLDGPTGAKTRHLVGYWPQGGSGQVSSAVVRFDASTRCAVTQSGRVYQIGGRPGSHSEARYVWARWKSINDIDQETDVSAEVYADILRASKGV
jgi:hypothetical protein